MNIKLLVLILFISVQQVFAGTIFTPYANGTEAYINFLGKAKTEIKIVAYAFTSKPITDKLIELNKKGVKIHIILDKSQSKSIYQKIRINELTSSGITVTIGNSSKGNLIHSKYTIIDKKEVEYGSWNYSKSADTQDNTMTFTKNKETVSLFINNWEQIYKDIKK